MVETYFTLLRVGGYDRLWATVICVLNNRKISATLCGAALLAGALSVPTAQAATVGEPVVGDSGETTCTISLNEAEKAHFETLTAAYNARTESTARITSFTEVYPVAGRVVAGLEQRLSNEADLAKFHANPLGTVESLAAGLAKQGVDRDAAFDVLMAVADPFLLDTPPSPLRFTEEAILAGTITPLTTGDVDRIEVLSEADFATEIASRYPNMAKEDAAKWAKAYSETAEIHLVKQAASLQVAFNMARELCGKQGGSILLPTKENSVNPDLEVTPYSTQGKDLPKDALDSGTSNTTSDNTTSEERVDSVNATATDQASSKSTGIIIGVVVAVLAVLGIGAAAFAMNR